MRHERSRWRIGPQLYDTVSPWVGHLNTHCCDSYLTEDLPHGLAVLRGIAEICGVETPTMDKVSARRQQLQSNLCHQVLTWAQDKIGESYLVDGKIQGKDVAKSGCPQRFGITNIPELMSN